MCFIRVQSYILVSSWNWLSVRKLLPSIFLRTFNSRFPSLASFPFVADPPSEDARWDSSNEGDEERGFKAVLTDTMSRRWATVSSWMFLVGSHCVVVVVVVQMRRVCDHRPTTRRRQLSSQTWRLDGKWDEVVCRYQQSVHTWREHSADSAHAISWSQIRSNKQTRRRFVSGSFEFKQSIMNTLRMTTVSVMKRSKHYLIGSWPTLTVQYFPAFCLCVFYWFKCFNQ